MKGGTSSYPSYLLHDTSRICNTNTSNLPKSVLAIVRLHFYDAVQVSALYLKKDIKLIQRKQRIAMRCEEFLKATISSTPPRTEISLDAAIHSPGYPHHVVEVVQWLPELVREVL